VQLTLEERHIIAGCSHKATVALREFIDAAITPMFQHDVRKGDYHDRLRDIYSRMQLWVRSLSELKEPMHFQAVCAGARSIFELLLDLRTLSRNPSLVDQLVAFTEVNRYQNAQKTVKLLERHPEIDRTRYKQQAAVVADDDRRREHERTMSKYWPSEADKRRNGPSHWFKGSVYGQCRELGVEHELAYRTEYAHHCWFVHAALVGVDGISEEGLVNTFTRAHVLVQRSVINATEIVGELFHFFDARKELRQELDFLRVLPGKLLHETGRNIGLSESESA
jgi:Family of unknown function (DUF5677)